MVPHETARASVNALRAPSPSRRRRPDTMSWYLVPAAPLGHPSVGTRRAIIALTTTQNIQLSSRARP